MGVIDTNTLNYKIISVANQDCLRNSLITLVSNTTEVDYRHFYLSDWNFSYLGKKKSYYHEVSDNRGCNIEILENIFNIKAIKCEMTNLDRFWNEIIIQINHGWPILFIADAYFSPFNRNYKTTHSDHSALISGYDIIKNTIYVIDAYDKVNNYEIKINEFYQYITGYWKFTKMNTTTQDFDYNNLINGHIYGLIKKNNDSNVFTSMKTLANDIIGNDNFKKEINNYKLESWYNIITKLSLTKGSRLQYIDFLKMIQEKTQNYCYQSIIKDLTNISNSWEVMLGLMRKAAYCETKYNLLIEKASKRLIEIACQEEVIARKLLSIVNGDIVDNIPYSEENIISIKIDKMQQIHVNMNYYYNNRAFQFSNSQKIYADFSNKMFIYIDINQFTRNDKKLIDYKTSSNISFNLPTFNSKYFDNMFCASQCISIPHDYYQAISFLGAAESGASSDYIDIIYDDDYNEIQVFEFNDWAGDNIFNAEEIIKFPAHKKINECESERVFDITMWAKTYQINCKRKLKKIKFPDYPNIHIFAITLLKIPKP